MNDEQWKLLCRFMWAVLQLLLAPHKTWFGSMKVTHLEKIETTLAKIEEEITK